MKRLVEQVLIQGVDSQTVQQNNVYYTYQKVQNLVVYPENSQLENIELWTFPNGVKAISSQEYQLLQKGKIESFVMTDQNQQKKYCSFVKFYHKRMSKISSFYVPYAFVLVSHINVLKQQKDILNSIINLRQTVIIDKRELELFEKMVEEEEGEDKAEIIFNKQMMKRSLEKSKVPSYQQIKIESNCLLEFYLNLLTQQLWISENSQEMKIQSLNGQSNDYLSEYNSNGFNTDLSQVFETLNVQNILNIYFQILLERQIVFIGNDSSKLINVIESLMKLIEPLEWQCVYIPNLVQSMNQILTSVLPFIVGIDKQQAEQLQMNQDVVLVDVDNDCVYNGDQIAGYMKQFLEGQLDTIVQKFRTSVRNRQMNQAIRLDIEIEIKQLFVTFMVGLLDNYCWQFDSLDSFRFDVEVYVSRMPLLQQLMIRQIHKTMMFQELIEKSQQSYNGEQNRVSWFVNIVRKLKLKWKVDSFDVLNNSRIRDSLQQVFFEKWKNEVIQSYENPIIIDINKYLVKYYLKIKQMQFCLEDKGLIEYEKSKVLDLKRVFNDRNKKGNLARLESQKSIMMSKDNTNQQLDPEQSMILNKCTLKVKGTNSTNNIYENVHKVVNNNDSKQITLHQPGNKQMANSQSTQIQQSGKWTNDKPKKGISMVSVNRNFQKSFDNQNRNRDVSLGKNINLSKDKDVNMIKNIEKNREQYQSQQDQYEQMQELDTPCENFEVVKTEYCNNRVIHTMSSLGKTKTSDKQIVRIGGQSGNNNKSNSRMHIQQVEKQQINRKYQSLWSIFESR